MLPVSIGGAEGGPTIEGVTVARLARTSSRVPCMFHAQYRTAAGAHGDSPHAGCTPSHFIFLLCCQLPAARMYCPSSLAVLGPACSPLPSDTTHLRRHPLQAFEMCEMRRRDDLVPLEVAACVFPSPPRDDSEPPPSAANAAAAAAAERLLPVRGAGGAGSGAGAAEEGDADPASEVEPERGRDALVCWYWWCWLWWCLFEVVLRVLDSAGTAREYECC